MLLADDQCLAKLRDTYAAEQALPTHAEICELLGLPSASDTAALLERLRDEGFLESTPDHGLQPADRFFDRVFMNGVQAGKPHPEFEPYSEGHQIDRWLIDEPSKTVILDVRGDSMIDAAVFDGDHAVVKKDVPVKPGDMVVAIVDGDYTIKFLAKDKKGYYLKPANKAYKNIRAKEELQIFGRVTGVFRRYK